MSNYFSNLFCSSGRDGDRVFSCVKGKISDNQNCGYHSFWSSTSIRKAHTDQSPHARTKYPHMNMVMNHGPNPGS